MSELWIPEADKNPDLSNLYDLMTVFQEQIESIDSRDTKMYCAKIATVSLARILNRLPKGERRVSLKTDLAIVDAQEDISQGQIVESLGIIGTVQDIHCVSLSNIVPLSLSLDIDVVKTFDFNDPDVDSYIHSNAITPIHKVQYIETLAS
jgi:hypothetical protein